jgi:membrane-bound lytic murein transglycosylase A
MLAHDTGDLIAGPARVDVFFGWGDKAEQTGGRQNARGTVWVLMPK